jgi:hypothetical protein
MHTSLCRETRGVPDLFCTKSNSQLGCTGSIKINELGRTSHEGQSKVRTPKLPYESTHDFPVSIPTKRNEICRRKGLWCWNSEGRHVMEEHRRNLAYEHEYVAYAILWRLEALNDVKEFAGSAADHRLVPF